MAKKENPKFERRHYELIAKILGGIESAKLTRPINGDLRADGYFHNSWHTQDLFIKMFKADNPNFDESRFKNAIGGAKELARLSPLTLKFEVCGAEEI
jgi:predicted metallopeptidase